MRAPRLVWQLYVPLVLLTLAVLAAATLHTTRTTHTVYLEQTRTGLGMAARAFAASFGDPKHTMQLDLTTARKLVAQLSHPEGLRVTVIAAGGTVLADTDKDPALMDNHKDRPEVRQALTEGLGSAVRYSKTVRRQMVYVALPLRAEDGRLAGVVRTSLPLEQVHRELRGVYRRTFAAGALLALLVLPIAFVISRGISRPLEQLGIGAARMARGERVELRLPRSASRETSELAERIAAMAEELEARLTAVEAERDQRMAVLASMVEGVLVVDERNRVVVINAAAAQLLRCDASKAAGKPLVELVRLPSLQRFVDATLQSAASREDEVIIDDGGRRHLQLHGSRLADPAGQGSTAVVVLHDVTRLRRLETVRREFVANVSHELKTPITSVQGFLDTLRDGAVDDPATARRFVEIAGRQADRLGAIIEDLLTLSRLEEASGGLSSTVQTRPLAPTLKAAIQICQHKADAKGIALSLDCPPDLTARFDPALLEQALINLIDNAVKYSPENTRVGIGGTAAGGAAEISVADEGCGIEAQHLPRLFERFYRVDKARSRNLGGTGLGLAIVKHIAQVHGATVTVNSEPGRGTVFVFRLPPLETKPEEFPS